MPQKTNFGSFEETILNILSSGSHKTLKSQTWIKRSKIFFMKYLFMLNNCFWIFINCRHLCFWTVSANRASFQTAFEIFLLFFPEVFLFSLDLVALLFYSCLVACSANFVVSQVLRYSILPAFRFVNFFLYFLYVWCSSRNYDWETRPVKKKEKIDITWKNIYILTASVRCSGFREKWGLFDWGGFWFRPILVMFLNHQKCFLIVFPEFLFFFPKENDCFKILTKYKQRLSKQLVLTG